MNFTITYDPIYNVYNIYEVELELLNGVVTSKKTYVTSKHELKDAHHFVATSLDYLEFTVAEIKSTEP